MKTKKRGKQTLVKKQTKSISAPVQRTSPWLFAFLWVFMLSAIFGNATVLLAQSYASLEKIDNSIFLATVLSPIDRDVVGKQIPFSIRVFAKSGVEKIDVYDESLSNAPHLLKTITGTGPVYSAHIDTSTLPDHDYAIVYAQVYTKSGDMIRTANMHLQIDRCSNNDSCVKVTQGESGGAYVEQTVSGVTPGWNYQVSYDAKRATASLVRTTVTNIEGTKTYAECKNELKAFQWLPSPECVVNLPKQAGQSVRLRFSIGEPTAPTNTDAYVYVDNVWLSPVGTLQNLIQNPSFENSLEPWVAKRSEKVTATPTTSIKPFDPGAIYAVSSSVESFAKQNLGFSFYKGWPKSQFTWWTKLGVYERPSIRVNPVSTYGYTALSVDRLRWFSPLAIHLQRESLDPSTFSFSKIVLTLQTDLGKTNICIPDLSLDNPLISGTQGTKTLLVDSNGNTYYAGEYNDPDALRPDNIAKRCSCTDGTQVGKCNNEQKVCGNDGSLQPSDCRVCGCAATSDICQQVSDGSYTCAPRSAQVEIRSGEQPTF